ncbi:MAG: tripartite tricarboxylate transporter substrate binding protein [Burkholderiaceae bacterium]|jgi:tripartite-type tricarboxylate transporter receptor subunit TctC|nr:tripartite tricarboxylate transporter substrate binding protein [Burkholderiales bacterium]MCZ8102223.1 tripartite tricarboxylate transporter substrate binding protein [Burkholderiales bacterium]MCZ8340274.1 tripartite tricarboxylate transporter substrate binding protein [Burkholderiaceae bacterium]
MTPTDRTRRSLVAAAAAAPIASLPIAARAQDAWPSRPVRVIVPFPAGGVVDLVTRAVTDRLAVVLKQPFVVEPRPGANGNIGTEAAARAAPDGYTLVTATPATVTQPLLSQAARFKTSDFVGVGLIGAPPNLFVVTPSLPVKSVKELVEHARAQPGKLSVTNPGVGTSNHLGQELFFSQTKLQMVDVRYPGQPQMIPDIASGQVHFGLVTAALALPHVREGRLRALAISAPKRWSELPDVPTVAEAGFPEAMFLPWYGLAAPAGTPAPIVKRLSDEIVAALATPDVAARLDKMGTQVTPGSASEFDALMRSEVERWSRVIKERNIRSES